MQKYFWIRRVLGYGVSGECIRIVSLDSNRGMLLGAKALEK